MRLLWLVWVVVGFSATAAVNATEKPFIVASMSWTPENGFELMRNVLANGPNVVAKANFTNAINETGWSYLEIVTMPEFPDKVQVCLFQHHLSSFSEFNRVEKNGGLSIIYFKTLLCCGRLHFSISLTNQAMRLMFYSIFFSYGALFPGCG